MAPLVPQNLDLAVTGANDNSFAPIHPFAQAQRPFGSSKPMTQDDLHAELAQLQQKHRDLDAAIDALQQSPAVDLIQLQRLKKRKLRLRDRISFIEDQLTPDIIA